jgi:type I restriction enzyme S subunit
MGNEHWVRSHLKDVVKSKKGKKPKILSPTQFEKSVPYIDIEAFEKGIIKQYADIQSSSLCVPEDILIVWDGARFGLTGTNIKGAIGSTLMCLSPKKINSTFLELFIKLNYNAIQQRPKGMATPHVDPDLFWNLNLLLPPIEEQQQIVQKLVAILPKIRKAKERLEKMQSIQDLLLSSIESDKTLKSTHIKLHNFIFECTDRIGCDWQSFKKIGVDNIKGIVPLRTTKQTGFETYKIVRKGNLVYNPMRVNIGSIALYDSDEIAITSPDYVVFNTINGLSGYYLFTFLKSQKGLNEINSNTQGAVRERLYFENLCKINISSCVVSNSEMYNNIFEWFYKFNKRKPHLMQLLEKIRQSVLAKAFRGELVEASGD